MHRLFAPHGALGLGIQCVEARLQKDPSFKEARGGAKKTTAAALRRSYYLKLPVRDLLKIHRKILRSRKKKSSEIPEIENDRYAACGIWRANIPSRTGIINDRTLPAAVSARTCPRNPSMAAAFAAVFSDTAGISPALYCAVNPR